MEYINLSNLIKVFYSAFFNIFTKFLVQKASYSSKQINKSHTNINVKKYTNVSALAGGVTHQRVCSRGLS